MASGFSLLAKTYFVCSFYLFIFGATNKCEEHKKASGCCFVNSWKEIANLINNIKQGEMERAEKLVMICHHGFSFSEITFRINSCETDHYSQCSKLEAF